MLLSSVALRQPTSFIARPLGSPRLGSPGKHRRITRQFIDLHQSPYIRWSSTHSPEDDAGSGFPSAAEIEQRIAKGLEEGKRALSEKGYDTSSFLEQTIVWGQLDSFRHVNNVHYLRFLESSRMKWILSFAHELGGPQKAADMIAGKGVSLILKQIDLRFRRPVTYPDTLLVAHSPHKIEDTQFSCEAIVWSCMQNRIVLTSDSVIVWYDYDHLKKCQAPEKAQSIITSRLKGHLKPLKTG